MRTGKTYLFDLEAATSGTTTLTLPAGHGLTPDNAIGTEFDLQGSILQVNAVSTDGSNTVTTTTA